MKLIKWSILAVVIVAVLLVVRWRLQSSAADTADQSERKPPALTVRVTPARLGSVQSWSFAEGTARSIRREYLIFENAGRVAYIKADEHGRALREGDTVTAGELLAYQDQRDYDAEIRTAESSLLEAKTRADVARAELGQAATDYALAETTFKRYAALLEKNSASQQEYDEAQARATNAKASVTRAESQITAAQAQVDAAESRLSQARLNMEETELRTPIDGIVAYLNIEQGIYFMPNIVRTDSESAALQSVPIVVIDPTAFEITVNVPAYVRDQIKIGQAVLIAVGDSDMVAAVSGNAAAAQSINDILAGFPVHGSVYSVNPAISPGGRSVQVKIRTTTGAKELSDGMFVTAWIATDQHEQVVVAPMNAVIYRDNQALVYIADADTGTARERQVTLGLRGFSVQEITTGVEAGELLVTDGRFQLSDNAKIQLLDAPDTSTEESR
jgi:RND family efflux transporter MFP subunit